MHKNYRAAANESEKEAGAKLSIARFWASPEINYKSKKTRGKGDTSLVFASRFCQRGRMSPPTATEYVKSKAAIQSMIKCFSD